VVDTGSLAGDTAAITKTAMERAAATGIGDLMLRLLAEASGDPELFAIFRDNLDMELMST
jgi:hypothetical protein